MLKPFKFSDGITAERLATYYQELIATDSVGFTKKEIIDSVNKMLVTENTPQRRDAQFRKIFQIADKMVGEKDFADMVFATYFTYGHPLSYVIGEMVCHAAFYKLIAIVAEMDITSRINYYRSLFEGPSPTGITAEDWSEHGQYVLAVGRWIEEALTCIPSVITEINILHYYSEMVKKLKETEKVPLPRKPILYIDASRHQHTECRAQVLSPVFCIATICVFDVMESNTNGRRESI